MKKTVEVGKMVRECPGGRHAWYESNVGLVRKPVETWRMKGGGRISFGPVQGKELESCWGERS